MCAFPERAESPFLLRTIRERTILRYKIDLKSFMADCELNYRRLLGLCPDLQVADRHTFAVDDPGNTGRRRRFVVRVLERAPYTLELEIAEQTHALVPWLNMPLMRVRLYRDAGLAEVVSFDGVRRVYPRYVYPNRQMHQPDEKAQWNRFLSEWLALVADAGYAESSSHVAIE